MKSFAIGCNYWASNAGMYMWRNFDAEVVEKDFALLSANGVDTVRIFPLWPDFQPVDNQQTYTFVPFKFRNGDEPLKTPAGLDPKQIENFATVLDLAEKYNLSVIVGLITGWMSGRLFVPSFLMNKNPLRDLTAIIWECRFIKEFIPHFIDRKCIVAWEYGNECNCLESVLYKEHYITHEEAEHWTASIANAIKSADPNRPVYTGMHSNRINNAWNIPMLSLYSDMQTTHPYPAFTPHCDTEKLTSMRAALHAAAESVYVADIAGQQCLVEEIGSLSPSTLSDSYMPEYIEKSLMSSFQYNTSGYLWWCGFEQNSFDFAPYDVSGLERELGLAYQDHTPKPALLSMKKMQEVTSEIGVLPNHEKDAVVILTDIFNDDDWTNSYGAFCLAAQAGYSVKLSHKSLPLEDSNYYILPINSDTHLRYFNKFYEKIEQGAKVLITYRSGYLSNFEKLTGLKIAGRERHNVTRNFLCNGKEISVPCCTDLILNKDTANVLIYDQNGEIVLAENKIGKGCVYFLNADLEWAYTNAYDPTETNMSEVYAFFFKDLKKPISFNTRKCTITYHTYENGKIGVILTNFNDTNEIKYSLDPNYTVEKTLYSSLENGVLKCNERYAYLLLKKKA